MEAEKINSTVKSLFDRHQVNPEKEAEIEVYEKQNLDNWMHERDTSYKSSHNNIGRHYWDNSLETFDVESDEMKNNIAEVRKFIDDVNGGVPRTLWMCGSKGTGKTALACIIAEKTHGMYRCYYNIDDELEDSRYRRESESRVKLFDRYARYPVLIIDEVGKSVDEKERIQETKTLFHIINDKYMNETSLVLVSNLTPSELGEYLGGVVTDRFMENCKSLVFTGQSYRKKIGGYGS